MVKSEMKVIRIRKTARPKVYKRSDERIDEDVCETLRRHPQIDASEMEVRVNEALVMLSGPVDSHEIRSLTEDEITLVQGVARVQNDLSVSKQEGQ